jgi:hypothetical protein
MGTKQNPGKYDCYEKAKDDEPMFVLLARDPLASVLVDLWARIIESQNGGAPTEKTLEARQCATDMRVWEMQRR